MPTPICPCGMTAEQFADWCSPCASREHRQEVQQWFHSIKWPEGFVYCSQSREYALKMGYTVVKAPHNHTH